MFRYHTYNTLQSNTQDSANQWEAGFFVLKQGVVYMFSDCKQRLPKRAIPLKGGQCQGFRRTPNSRRPHTFEILLQPNKALQFAAPDENVASDWLQSFIQSASGLFDRLIKKEPLARSLVVTTKHLVVVKEQNPGKQDGQILSCLKLADILAFKESITEQEPWCILELAREEGNREWVVHFADLSELRVFREVCENLWGKLKLDVSII